MAYRGSRFTPHPLYPLEVCVIMDYFSLQIGQNSVNSSGMYATVTCSAGRDATLHIIAYARTVLCSDVLAPDCSYITVRNLGNSVQHNLLWIKIDLFCSVATCFGP
jgi:hypothetical protein